MTHPKKPSESDASYLLKSRDHEYTCNCEPCRVGQVERVAQALDQARREAIKDFYAKVCERAESKMLKTGKLEGAHFASMKEIIAEL